MPHFVLDHSFPHLVLEIKWPPSLTLQTLRSYDERLTRNHEDWQVLRELDRREDVDGYISNDAKMLNLATEMVTLHLSRLILVVTDGPENDPIAATGLLMTHLVEVTRREREAHGAQLYRLRPINLGQQRMNVPRLLEEIANRQYVQRDAMIAQERRQIEAWTGLPQIVPQPESTPHPRPRRKRR